MCDQPKGEITPQELGPVCPTCLYEKMQIDGRWVCECDFRRLRALNAELVAGCEAAVASPRSQHVAGGFWIQVCLPPTVITQMETAIAKAKAEGS